MAQGPHNEMLTRLHEATCDFPTVLETASETGRIRLVFNIQRDLIWFAGHFPEFPVLPGIVQVHWAAAASRALFNFTNPPTEIKRLKFRKLVIPPCELEMTLTQHDEAEVQFAFSSGDQQNSEGRMVFRRQPNCESAL